MGGPPRRSVRRFLRRETAQYMVVLSRLNPSFFAGHMHGAQTYASLEGSLTTIRVWYGRVATRNRLVEEEAALLDAACHVQLDEDIFQVLRIEVSDAYAARFGLRSAEDAVALERIRLNEPFALLPCGHILKVRCVPGLYRDPWVGLKLKYTPRMHRKRRSTSSTPSAAPTAPCAVPPSPAAAASWWAACPTWRNCTTCW